ncbi:hypothetical protein [Prolixibacter bellariivorans]|nr:hypothetical protein [Prolixibacter bellariivorans]
MSFRVSILLLMLNFGVLLLPDIAYAKNKEVQGLEVEGKIRTDEGGLNGATIEVYKADNDELEQTATVDETGKFALQLAFQHDYYFIFRSRGCYPKKLILNAVIPEKVLKRDPYFPPIKVIVTLFKVIPEINPSFSEKPVGKIFYSAKLDNFDSESYFNDVQIREKIDEEVATTYQEKLNVAKTLEEDGNLAQAMDEYQRAVNLKQGDDSVKEKIVSLGKKIEQEKQANQAEAARKDSMDNQLVAASLETADTTDNTLEIQANQSASVRKTPKVTAINEKKNLTVQTQSDSAEIIAQTVKVEPEKVLQDSARKEKTETEKHEAVATTETTEIQKIEQEKAEPLSVDSEDKGSVLASIQPHGNDSANGILPIFGLILFAFLVLLWFRRKAKQEHTTENE